MFKECLNHNIVPFIITDELKMFYYRGLRNWPNIKGYLTDTCLTAQDHYKARLDIFGLSKNNEFAFTITSKSIPLHEESNVHRRHCHWRFHSKFLALRHIRQTLCLCKIGLFPREEILFHAIAFGLVWAAIVGYRKYKKMK